VHSTSNPNLKAYASDLKDANLIFL